jgi:hypothetical protein
MNAEECFKRSISAPHKWHPSGKDEVSVAFFIGNNGYDATMSTLRLDSVIDEFVVHIFENGQCHAMALALHDILGWPIVGLYDTSNGSRHTNHFAVSCNGYIGCVKGLRRDGESGSRKVNPATLRKSEIRGFLPPCHEFARHHAQRVATELLKQMDDGIWNPDWWKK